MEPLEFLGNLILLIVGGNDTTRNSMSGGLYAFNKFPDQLEKLRANPFDSDRCRRNYSVANTTRLHAKNRQ